RPPKPRVVPPPEPAPVPMPEPVPLPPDSSDAGDRPSEESRLGGRYGATFADHDPEEQARLVWEALVGAGPLLRETAVREAAERLREEGLLDYARLRRDGRTWDLVHSALRRGIRAGSFDKPGRGLVRAIIPNV